MKSKNIVWIASGLAFTFLMTLNFSVFITYDGYQGIDYSLMPLYSVIAIFIMLPIYYVLFLKKNICDKLFADINSLQMVISFFLTFATCYKLLKDVIKNYDKISQLTPIARNNYIIVSIGMVVLAGFIIFAIYLYSCKILVDFWNPILSTLSKYEKRFICGMFIVMVMVIVIFYTRVYGQWDSLDLIYQTDCTFLYHHYYPVYSFGFDYDWDIGNGGVRHPLMTMYTYPIYIVVWCCSKLLFWVPNAMAILYVVVDTTLIILMGILVNRLCNNEWSLLLYATCSPVIFYIVFLEKYQLVVFFLLMYVYSIVNNHSKESERYFLIASSGTMITSAFLGFFYGKEKLLKKRLLEWVEVGCSFFAVMVATGRIHYILDVRYLIHQNYYMFHSGEHSTIVDVAGTKIYILWRAIYNQTICPLTNLAASCFVPIEHSDHGGYIYWDGLTDRINWLGLLICVVMVCAFVRYRREKTIQICGVWFAFAMIHMVAFNAGAAPLFNLYYAWMFIVMMSTIARDYVKTIWQKVLVYGLTSAIMLTLNIDHMHELYNFLMIHTPL